MGKLLNFLWWLPLIRNLLASSWGLLTSSFGPHDLFSRLTHLFSGLAYLILRLNHLFLKLETPLEAGSPLLGASSYSLGLLTSAWRLSYKLTRIFWGWLASSAGSTSSWGWLTFFWGCPRSLGEGWPWCRGQPGIERGQCWTTGIWLNWLRKYSNFTYFCPVCVVH